MALFNFLAKPFSILLAFFYNITGHYWLAIVLLSVLIRVAMYPLYKKQILSTSGMADMQPKMNEIKKKYANDKDMMNQKIAELYKESGFNPSAGCMPMLVQFIVISGLFILLRNPLNYVNDENMVFAVHESFLWIKDLCQPDPWILPILSGIATFFSFSMSQQNQLGQQGSNMGMGMMKYIYPVLSFVICLSSNTMFAIYWMFTSIYSVAVDFFFNLYYKRKEEKASRNKAVK